MMTSKSTFETLAHLHDMLVKNVKLDSIPFSLSLDIKQVKTGDKNESSCFWCKGFLNRLMIEKCEPHATEFGDRDRFTIACCREDSNGDVELGTFLCDDFTVKEKEKSIIELKLEGWWYDPYWQCDCDGDDDDESEFWVHVMITCT